MSAVDRIFHAATIIAQSCGHFLKEVARQATSVVSVLFTSMAQAIHEVAVVAISSWRGLALSATGADEEKLTDAKSPEEYTRFVVLGSIVILTACFATLGAIFFFSRVFASQDALWKHPVVGIFSVLWGLVIFFIDRVFLSTMMGKDNWWERFSSGVFRLILAALLGYVISHPLKILFFADTIKSYNGVLFEEYRRKYNAEATLAVAEASDKVSKLGSEIATMKRATPLLGDIAKVEKQIELANDLILRETDQKGRDEVVEKYRNGTIRDLMIPLSNGSVDRIEVPVILEPSCRRDDVLLLEYRGFIRDDIEISDQWLRNLSFKYSEYARDPSLVKLERPVDPDNPDDEGPTVFEITSCSLGTILAGIWEREHDRLLEGKRDAEANVTELKELQRQLEYFERTADGEREYFSDLKENAVVNFGRGYAHETSLLWELSDSTALDLKEGEHGFPMRIDRDDDAMESDPDSSSHELRLRRFNEPEFRESIFWIGWAISAIFIFVEMAPVIAKIFLTPGPYERSLGARQRETGDESAEERRKQRHFADLENEAQLEHNYSVRSLARSFLLGAESYLGEWVAKRIEEAVEPEEHEAVLDAADTRLERVRSFAAKLYRSAEDDGDVSRG